MAEASKLIASNLIPERRLRKTYLTASTAATTLQTALNITSGEGFLIGISISNSDVLASKLDVVLDGDSLLTDATVLSAGAGVYIPFNETYLASLVIKYRNTSVSGDTTIVIIYTDSL